jgi:DNA-binding winged helix-turn-helix (wHTH) protein/Tol biopolymer transport system component
MMANKSLFFSFEDVEVREREFSVIKAGEAIQIEPKAFRVLLIFLRNPQKLLTKEELLNAVWGDTAVTENSLTRAIALLRRSLDDDSRTPRYIETVSSVGYRFLCPVEVGEDSTVRPDPVTAGKNGDVVGVAGSATPTSPQLFAKSRWMWVLAAGAAAIILLAAGVWYLSRPLPPLTITAYTQITHDGREKILAGTDGNRLYFTEISPYVIAQVGVNGGEIAQFPIEIPGYGFQLNDISPDASYLLISAPETGQPDFRQWLVPMLGGAAKRFEDGSGSRFSPDGGSVIYSSKNGDIFMVRTDGTEKRQLASVGSPARRFSWSPDGKVIRFSRADGIQEMSSDGAGVHPLFPGWKQGPQCCGQWTPDGSLYVFVANDDFVSSGQLWALDERRGRQSSAPIQLTSGPILWSYPIPGRDGKTIFAVGANRKGELSRIDVKTGISQPFLGGISAEFVSFSPDGKSLAYAAFPEGTLWKTDLDGSNRLQLTQPPDRVINPRWSPDSKEIVFGTITRSGPRHQSIRRVSVADGKSLWLMSEESGDMAEPNWSPDGTKVLFAKGLGYAFAPGKRDLRIVDLKSRQVTVLPGSDDMWSARWSHDGRYVVAFHDVAGEGPLQLFDIATQRWRILPVTGGYPAFPSFTRDGRFIYFLRTGPTPERGIYRIPVAGGGEERLVNMADWHLTGFFGYSMSLDPSDAPLVLRDMGSIDIYALILKEK